MKKTFTILAAAAVALSASAAMPGNMGVKFDQKGNTPVSKTELIQKGLNVAKKAPVKFAAPKKADDPTPAGESRLYDVYATSSYIYWWWIVVSDTNGSNEMIFADNGDVYTKNLVYGMAGQHYVKGHIDGDKLTFNFPQDYYEEEYEDEETGELVSDSYPLMVLDYETVEYVDEDTGEPYLEYFFTPSEDQTFEFSYDPETGAIKSVTDKAIGLVYYDEEAGEYVSVDVCDFNYSMTWINWVTRPEIPETLEYKSYIFEGFDMQYSEDVAAYADVAFDGDYMYIKGMSQNAPGLIIRAEKSADGWYVPNGQFLGEDFGYEFYSYACNAWLNDDWELDYSPLDGFWFTVDEDRNVIAAKDPEASFSFNAAFTRLYTLDIYSGISLTQQNPPAVAKPMAAMGLEFDDYYWEDGFGNELTFYAYPFTEDGEVLPKDRLFWQFFVDGDPHYFDPEDHPYLDEEVSIIPYSFTDNYDFECDGAWHHFYFYVEGMDTVGIQMLYLNDDGTYTRSNMATLDLTQVNVESIAASSDATYYDLSGRRVANPAKGIYIVRSADKTRKVIVK